MTRTAHWSVIVIGAGMAGLAAAHSLRRAGLKVAVLEREAHVGGRVRTESVEGFDIDTGAQFITNFYPHTKRLIREVGLAEELARLPSRVAILRAGRLYHLQPDWRLPATGLISTRSKLGLAKVLWPLLRYWRSLDFHALWKAQAVDTRSITDYARRTWPDEVLAYVIEPPLSGFLYWTPEHTSQAMLFVLLKASLGIRLFILRHGLGQMAERLAATLTVHCNAEVLQVIPNAAGGYSVQVRLAGEVQAMTADGIVCAAPAFTVPGMIPGISAIQRAFFEDVRYSANTVTAIGLRQRIPANAYGVLFPRAESRYLAVAAVESAKGLKVNRPQGDLVMLYPSGPAAQELLPQPDFAIRSALVADLGQAGSPYVWDASAELFHRVYRWPQALPEFDVGHLKRLKHFAEGQIESGAVVFAGDYLGGPFVEGAVTSGIQAAERLLRHFRLRTTSP